MAFGGNISHVQNVSFTEETDIATLARSHHYFTVGMAINDYYGPLIIVCGLLGNTLSFIVMSQSHNKRISCYVYLAALAVMDNLMMVNCFDISLMIFMDSFSDNHCRFCSYQFQVCGGCSAFIITAVTLERYLAICYPLKSASRRSTARAKKTICGIFVFSVLCNIPYIFTARVNPGSQCTTVACYSFWCKVWSWTGFALNFVVPFLIITILNILILRAIRSRGKYFSDIRLLARNKPTERETLTISTRSLTGDSSKDTQLTAMLLLVTTCFLIVTSPQYIRYILFANYDIYKDIETFARLSILYQCTQKSFYTNSAINFFLYCIAGSRFRKDCVKLFCKRGKYQEGSLRKRNKESSSMDTITFNMEGLSIMKLHHDF